MHSPLTPSATETMAAYCEAHPNALPPMLTALSVVQIKDYAAQNRDLIAFAKFQEMPHSGLLFFQNILNVALVHHQENRSV